MSLTTIQQILALVTAHQWLPLAVLVVGLLMSWTSDTSKFPINIPDRFKPLVALVLGAVYAILQAVSGGTAWVAAIENGLVVALCSVGFSSMIVTTIFNGKVPSWLSWLNLHDPALVQAKKVGKKISSNVFGRSRVVEDTPKAA